MAANNEMTCWAAEGYPMLAEPPPGPYLTLDDARESNCQLALGPDGEGVATGVAAPSRTFLGPQPASCLGVYVIDLGVTTRKG